MDQINVLKTIQLPESITGGIKDKFDAIDANFNTLGSSTYTAGKDGVTRVHTFKFNGVEVENEKEFKDWLTSQLGISNPKEVVDSIVNAFANYDNTKWYANGSYEIYIGTDGNIKEALPILYVKDNTISYLGFEYEKDVLTEKDVLILKPKQGTVLGIEDGYWVINGIKTDIKAEGVAGENGKDGLAIEFGFVTVEHANIKARGVEPFIKDNDNNIKDKNGNLVDKDGNRIDENRVNILVPILKIVQYWDHTKPNNYVSKFDDIKDKDEWLEKNKNRVFLFTYTYKVTIKDNDGNNVVTTKSQTYMGYVTKYTHAWNSNIPESEPVYGFYYSDATMYSPGAGGSGVSGLITALDNMVYDQQVGDKPRGIWFKKTEDEKDKEAIFMYNNDNTLNICKIDDYTKAYNTGDIKEESTKVKVNGDFECDGAIISKNTTTIKGETSINDNLKLYGPSLIGACDTIIFGTLEGNTIGQNRVSIYSSKNGSEQEESLGLIPGDRYIQVASNHNIDGVDDWKITHVCPGMITVYSDNKLTTITESGITSSSTEVEQINTNNIAFPIIKDITFPLFKLNLSNNGIDFIYQQHITSTFENRYYFHKDGEIKCSNIITDDIDTKYIKTDSAEIPYINGDVIINDNLTVRKDVITTDNLRVKKDNNYAGIYTTTENSFDPEGLSSLELSIGNKYIQVGDLEQNHATTITPTKITSSNLKLIGDAVVNGDMTINGTLHVTSITTDESAGGDTSTTNFKDLTVAGSTNLKDLTVIGSIPYYIYNYMNNGYFEYPKLIYDVLNKSGIINKSKDSPYSLNIDEKVCQTNYCNLYIKSYGTTYFYNYTNNNSIYSVSVNDNNSGINRKGNLYRITGYIIIGDNSKNEIDFTAGNPVSNRDEYFYFDNGTNPNSYNTIPQMIYIDDYFAFIKNGTPSDIIITPYGIRNSIFAPHYVTSKETVNDKPTTIYKYNLNSMTSNINGGADNSNISIAKQSVMHTLGNDLKFKLIYNIPQKS